MRGMMGILIWGMRGMIDWVGLLVGVYGVMGLMG